ncbi:hypothetical protein [Dyadobacter luteus]|nr:hypothetical protein [Dyadobacter luteus]
MTRVLLLFFLISMLACRNSISGEKLLASINTIKSDLENMVAAKSCAANAGDCRLKVIFEPSGCPLVYVYNSKDVDSLKLASKFSELKRLQREYAIDNPIGPVCDYYILDSLYVKDCKCVAGLKGRGF